MNAYEDWLRSEIAVARARMEKEKNPELNRMWDIQIACDEINLEMHQLLCKASESAEVDESARQPQRNNNPPAPEKPCKNCGHMRKYHIFIDNIPCCKIFNDFASTNGFRYEPEKPITKSDVKREFDKVMKNNKKLIEELKKGGMRK